MQENNSEVVIQEFLKLVEETSSLNSPITAEDIPEFEKELEKIELINYKKPNNFKELLDSGLSSYLPSPLIIPINKEIKDSLAQAARKGKNLSRSIKEKMENDKKKLDK